MELKRKETRIKKNQVYKIVKRRGFGEEELKGTG